MASHIARSLALLILVETACCFCADVGVRGLRSIQPGAAKAIRATSKPVVAKSMIAAGSSSVATAGPALADADEELRHLVDGDRCRLEAAVAPQVTYRISFGCRRSPGSPSHVQLPSTQLHAVTALLHAARTLISLHISTGHYSSG